MQTLQTFKTGEKMVLFSSHNTSLFEQYQSICNFHYVQKHSWETDGCTDEYRMYCQYVALLNKDTFEDTLIVGARVITDVNGLPIRSLLTSCGLPAEQVPAGSHEISRFVVDPDVLRSKQGMRYTQQFAAGLITYFHTANISVAYAVLRCELAKRLSRIGVYIEPLPEGTITRHGTSSFSTVRMERERSMVKAINE